jgi:hypothetical protein
MSWQLSRAGMGLEVPSDDQIQINPPLLARNDPLDAFFVDISSIMTERTPRSCCGVIRGLPAFPSVSPASPTLVVAYPDGLFRLQLDATAYWPMFSALNGSTPAARHAGMKMARSEIPVRIAPTARITPGSNSDTSKSRL